MGTPPITFGSSLERPLPRPTIEIHLTRTPRSFTSKARHEKPSITGQRPLGVPGAKSGWVGSFHGACRHDPLAALAGHRRDQVKVGVVVEDSDAEFLGGSCDQEVGDDLAASLTALSEEALDLKCPARVRRGGIDKFKRPRLSS